MPPPWALEVHEVWPSRGVEFVTGLASSTWSPSGRDARVCWSRISVSSSCSWWCSSSGADRSPAEAAGVVRRPGARRSAPPGVGRVHVHHPVGGTGPGGQRSRVTRALGSPGTASSGPTAKAGLSTAARRPPSHGSGWAGVPSLAAGLSLARGSGVPRPAPRSVTGVRGRSGVPQVPCEPSAPSTRRTPGRVEPAPRRTPSPRSGGHHPSAGVPAGGMSVTGADRRSSCGTGGAPPSRQEILRPWPAARGGDRRAAGHGRRPRQRPLNQ